MKKIRIYRALVFLVLFLVVCYFEDLPAVIHSRLIGILVDKDTRKAIADTEVWLYSIQRHGKENRYRYLEETQTDKMGRFVFSNFPLPPESNEICLTAVNPLYAQSGPAFIMYGWSDECCGLIPAEITPQTFLIKAGETRFVKMEIERAARLIISVKGKIPSNPLGKTRGVRISLKHTKYAGEMQSTIDRSSEFGGFDSGKLTVTLFVENCPKQMHSVALKKGETTQFNINLDSLPGAAISGSLTSKTTGKPLEGVQVLFMSIHRWGLLRTYTDKSGRFRFTGIDSGTYRLEYFRAAVWGLGRKIVFAEEIALKKGEKKTIRRSL